MSQEVFVGSRHSLVLLVLFCWNGFAAPDSRYTIGPAPAWVTPAEVEIQAETPRSGMDSGFYYLLFDRQVSRIGTQEIYVHNACRVTSVSAVPNASQLSITFDPSYEDLTIHSIRILRDGKSLDRLDPTKFNVIQREKDLEAQQYNGQLSVLSFLDDVRVGDVIESSYTLRGANPVFEGRYVDRVWHAWNSPIRYFRQRLVFPYNQSEIMIKALGRALAPTFRETGSVREYVWQATNVEAIISDTVLPAWCEPFPSIQFSEYASWADVARWAIPLYTQPRVTPREIVDQVEKWRRSIPDLESRILAAIRFVQDDVRYLGIELGPNSHKPADPGTVFARRFGDCKDKARLLCVLLNELGVKAYPAFVNTYLKDKVAAYHPSPLAFNHTIVCFEYAGRAFWVDATRSHQGGRLERFRASSFRKALVVRDFTTDLSDIPEDTQVEPTTSITETYRLADSTKPVPYEIEIVHHDAAADGFRAIYSSGGQEAMERDYLNYFARWHPSLKATGRFRAIDDPTQNIVTVSARYLITDFWTVSSNSPTLSQTLLPWLIRDEVGMPTTRFRKMPLGINHPTHLRQTLVVTMNEPWQVQQSSEMVQDRAMLFGYSSTYTQNTARVVYEYRTLSDHIRVDEMDEHVRALDRILNLLPYQLTRSNQTTRRDKWDWLDEMNWMVAFIAGLSVLLFLFAATSVYRRSRRSGEPPEITDPALNGIRGWLVLIGIGICLMPILLLNQIVQSLPAYALSRWNMLTSPSASSYHPAWMPVLLLELICNLGYLVFSILLIVLYFQKRRSFPMVFVVMRVLYLLMLSVEAMVVPILQQAGGAHEAGSTGEVIRFAVPTVIWVWYMLVSKRVKATFTR
jgi:transglutaminase-like putative cysteine protease